jgi:uncharacterized membrane protein YphA (DoxX/SURF4 family)
LLLRATVGLTALVQGGTYLNHQGSLSYGMFIVGVLGVASGISLLIGFLTPIASSLVGFGSAATLLSWLPAPTPNLFGASLTTWLVVTMAIAIACLGPGAFSLDCRMFGHREIVIPRATPSPKS